MQRLIWLKNIPYNRAWFTNLNEMFVHLWGIQSLSWGSVFTLRKLKDYEVWIKSLHTTKVFYLFFGWIFSFAYLLEGVHFRDMGQVSD